MGDVQQEQALTLELSPNSIAESNNEKGKIKGDSSNKEAKEIGWKKGDSIAKTNYQKRRNSGIEFQSIKCTTTMEKAQTRETKGPVGFGDDCFEVKLGR
ncbi:hypothetical protein GRJ2_002020000 [Grus japonensis]|uniref:Uncharacterized protein n=1 Tax=Grus japonensis TaxID=30415 RepID=A0ABC9XEV3_GRUJA